MWWFSSVAEPKRTRDEFMGLTDWLMGGSLSGPPETLYRSADESAVPLPRPPKTKYRPSGAMPTPGETRAVSTAGSGPTAACHVGSVTVRWVTFGVVPPRTKMSPCETATTPPWATGRLAPAAQESGA